jgi:hypothetical protein
VATGSGAENPTLVGHTSPTFALGVDALPISRSAAGTTGIGTIAPPDTESPSGRSLGTNAERWTVRSYPAVSLLTTVTCSEIGDGVAPETVFPKLIDERSSAIESTCCKSTSTEAAVLAEGPGGVVALQDAAGDAELRGDGATAVKSAALEPVSAQPASARVAAVVLLSA